MDEFDEVLKALIDRIDVGKLEEVIRAMKSCHRSVIFLEPEVWPVQRVEVRGVRVTLWLN